MPILTLSVRQNVAKVLDYSNNTKRPITLASISISLKNYKPKRNKRFSSTVKLPTFDINRTKYGGIDAISANDLKKLNKNKKLARKYEAFVTSETLIKQIPRIKITKVKSTVKLPTLVSHADDLSSKITKNLLYIGVAIGNALTTKTLLRL
ncbi:hypothetical protein BT67DRAFT_452835 [Trichocladium antarcticum]|uniref:Uncharacterized protein n=1 Tax=Trichocladium antarcticum TaxID=1450529 RepID=A0AAN6Z9S3_9PEZI|nr:hypothetical protein BT67DRAFT_452835 [Trichocladium antarcticum]